MNVGAVYRTPPIILNDKSLSPNTFFDNGFFISPSNFLSGPGIYVNFMKSFGLKENYEFGLSTTLRFTELYYKTNQFGYTEIPIRSAIYDVAVSARHRLMSLSRNISSNQIGKHELLLEITMGYNGGGSTFMTEYELIGGTGFIGVEPNDLRYSSGEISIIYRNNKFFYRIGGHIVLSNENLIWQDPPPIVLQLSLGYKLDFYK
jgi:hypothetical protein